MTKAGTRHRVACYFRAYPHRWISALTIARLAILRHTQAISECRKAGMTIRNKVDIVRGRRVSSYRFEP